MTLGLVLDPWEEARPSGLGRAVRALTEALERATPRTQYLALTKKSVGGGRFWLERMRSAPRADAYLFFTPVLPFSWVPPQAIVIAHDVGYFDVPVHGLRARLARAILIARHDHALTHAWKIVAVSHATKDALVKHFNLSPEKITVIYDGTNDFNLVAPELVAHLPERFFLFAGVVKERKNVLTLIRAFAEYVAHGGTESLVIAGKAEGAYADLVRREAASLGDRVRFLGFVSDGELAYLYRHALAFVYPSLAEGFGMTIVEAMSTGLPVITSTDPAIVEVAGDAALLVAPYDIATLAAAMRTLANDLVLCERLAAAGRARATEFSWDRAALDLLKLLS